MAQPTQVHTDVELELFVQLLRCYRDDEFRKRIEEDELKQPTNHPEEVLLQHGHAELEQAAVLAYQFKNWLGARTRMARRRQDATTAQALGMSLQELSQTRSRLHETGAVQVPIRHGDGPAETGHA